MTRDEALRALHEGREQEVAANLRGFGMTWLAAELIVWCVRTVMRAVNWRPERD